MNNRPRGLGILRTWVMSALMSGLRGYTRYAPFKRGRGAFLWPIWMLTRLGWAPPSISVGYGVVMEFETSLIGWTCFEQGGWEPAQTALIERSIKSGGVVLNVGANTGYYALIAASLVGPEGRVHAFEIQPRIIEILRRNVLANGYSEIINVVECGCYSSEGEATFECPGDPGSARLEFGGSGVRVALTTIDIYAAANKISRIDSILVDAEGADLEVLKGASQVLRRFKPIVIAEAHLLEAFGGSENQMIAFMESFGYSTRVLQGDFSRDLVFSPNRSVVPTQDAHSSSMLQ